MRKQIRDPPTESIEEHKVARHHLRLGINFGKDDKGEMGVSLKGGVDNFKDKVTILGDNKDKVFDSDKDIIKNNGDSPEQ